MMEREDLGEEHALEGCGCELSSSGGRKGRAGAFSLLREGHQVPERFVGCVGEIR